MSQRRPVGSRVSIARRHVKKDEVIRDSSEAKRAASKIALQAVR